MKGAVALREMIGRVVAETPVILMDDDGRFLSKLAAEFRRLGFENVKECKDGSAVIASLRIKPTGILSIDLDMGGGRRDKGIETIGEITKEFAASKADLYIIALTTHMDLGTAAIRAGAQAVVEKRAEMDDNVQRVLVRALARRENELATVIRSLAGQVTERTYVELARQVNQFKKHRPMGWRTAEERVREALSFPYLHRREKIILSALSELLRKVLLLNEKEHSGQIDSISQQISHGIQLLREPSDKDDILLEEWVAGAQIGEKGIFRWLDDDYTYERSSQS